MNNIRLYIALVENENTTKYYHGSKSPYKIGTTLHGRPIQHSDEESQWTETILEHTKPHTQLSRNKAVFMVNEPNIDTIEKVGGYPNYIYELTPLNNISQHDTHWWTEIYQYAISYNSTTNTELKLQMTNDINQLAHNYWYSIPSHNPTWEYLTASATISNLINGYLANIK